MTKEKNNHQKEHEDFIKKENEWCFLPNKEKIRYHSFIMLELFNLEDFCKLESGLDRLYQKLNPLELSHLNYKEALSRFRGKLFSSYSTNLPNIYNGKLREDYISGVFYNLGDNINYMDLKLFRVLPSVAVLQIQIYLREDISKEVNNTIYNYNNEEEKRIKTSTGSLIRTYSPEHIKTRGILKLKNKIKKEAINFLSQYFEGSFFKVHKKDIDIVPSIDVYSLNNYPIKNEKILDWSNVHSCFFHCLGTSIAPYESYIENQYLFSINSNRRTSFSNYSIFANREKSKNDIYETIDDSITEGLNFYNFSLLAINRWIDIQEFFIGRFNSIVSKEFLELDKLNIGDIIKERRDLSKKLFIFKRFKSEYENILFIDKYNLICLKTQRNLFKILKENIKIRLKNMDEIISLLFEHSNQILNLKNIEYDKKIKNMMLFLTYLMIAFMVMDILVSSYPSLFKKIIFDPFINFLSALL